MVFYSVCNRNKENVMEKGKDWIFPCMHEYVHGSKCIHWVLELLLDRTNDLQSPGAGSAVTVVISNELSVETPQEQPSGPYLLKDYVNE